MARKIEDEDVFALKRKLRLLHNFSVVHVDIKPENIMFSPTSEELVFIDFGFSRVLK